MSLSLRICAVVGVGMGSALILWGRPGRVCALPCVSSCTTTRDRFTLAHLEACRNLNPKPR